MDLPSHELLRLLAMNIDIEDERLEQLEDLEALEELRREPLKLRRLEDFLAEYSPNS